MKFSKKIRTYSIATIIIFTTIALIFTLNKKMAWHVPNSNIEQNYEPITNIGPVSLSFEKKYKPWTVNNDQGTSHAILFDIFTSPNIYKEGDKLVMEPCLRWQFDSIFPLQLQNIVKKKYRLQFEGYIQADKESNFIILLHDLENDQSLRCTDKQKFNTLEFEILSFQVRTIEKNDMIISMPIVKIMDTRDRMEIELNGDTKYYDNKYDVILEDTDGQTYVLPELNREIQINESLCSLESVDPENCVVSIILTDSNKQKFYKRLRMIR